VKSHVSSRSSSSSPEIFSASAMNSTVACVEGEYEATNPRRYVHPALYFYTPDDPNLPSEDDLEHLLVNDNALVVAPTDAADAPPVEAFTRFSPPDLRRRRHRSAHGVLDTRQSSVAEPHAEESD
jgi:hypothetical protein